MSPTKEHIAFFTSEKAKRIQEEWEPKFGDRLCPKGVPPGFHQVYIHGTGLHHVAFLSERDMTADIESIADLERHYIWLPRPGQLWEILEERGYRWDVGKLPDSYTATIWNDDVDLECEGPTPSIALGRALIEVMGKEEPEDLDQWIGEDIEAEIKRQFPDG